MKRLVLNMVISCLASGAHSTCLDQYVNLICRPCSIEEAIEQMEAQVSCSFSYNSSQFDHDTKLDLFLTNVPIASAIQQVTNGEFELKEYGRYVLIKQKEGTTESKPEKKTYQIEGYVRNAQSGEVLQKATVYAVGNKYSAVTNENGYYKLQLNSEEEFLGLSYCKQQYFDTVIVVKPADNKLRQDISLLPREKAPDKMPIRPMNSPPREVEELTMVKFLVPEPQRELALNFDFLEKIPVQVSFLPSIGTNFISSGYKTNAFSLNVLAGYNAGVTGAEIGGLANIVREDVNGIQIGGLANVVGGEVSGVQIGGLFNNVRGSINGAQVGGVYNIVLDTITGVQVAGMFNVLHGSIDGSQLAGFANIATENMSGLQAAGFANITRKDVMFAQAAGFNNYCRNAEGLQAAGFVNLASGSVSGMQAAGFTNVAKDTLTGFQAAGFSNHAKSVTGLQMAGFMNTSLQDATFQLASFMNVAKTVKGAQIGLFNFSDSSALSIGLLSFSLKYNHLDLNADELHPLNLSYRLGSRRFYNILAGGYGSYYGVEIYSYGYGIGTEFRPLEKRSYFNIEAFARNIVGTSGNYPDLALDMKLEPSMAIRLGKKRPLLVFGPSIHLMVQGDPTTEPAAFGKETKATYPPVFDPVDNFLEVDSWIGFKAGLRI